MTSKTAQNAAKAMLDAWQETLRQQLTDPRLIEAMLRGMQGFANAAPNHTGEPHAAAPSHAPAPRADVTEPDAIALLNRRMAKLERALKRLESRVADTPAKPVRKPAKPVAKPTKPKRKR